MPKLSPTRKMIDGFSHTMTMVKSDTVIGKGYDLTGFCFRNKEGDLCIVELAAVRWMSREEAWRLMHPPINEE